MTQSFKQFLQTESFDSRPARWKRHKIPHYIIDGKNNYVYKFDVDKNQFNVNIQYEEDVKGVYFYDISFALVTMQDGGFFGKMKSTNYKLTNTGNQYKVLVTVVDCIRDFVLTENPTDPIVFFALDEGLDEFGNVSDQKQKSVRAKVYQRLIKKYLPKNYQAKIKQDSLKTTFFIMPPK
jgi:hypothetical protein